MASSINASTTAGVVTTADTSGVLNIQTAGTTAVTISSGQVATFAQAPVLPAASIPQAALAAGVAGNGPAFSAFSSGTTQSITSATATKMLFDTESFDTNNNFASSRFTPTISGYYQINGFGTSQGSSGTISRTIIYIFKNGGNYRRGGDISGVGFGVGISDVVYLNGSTDYVELYFYIVTTGSAVIGIGENNTFFSGSMVRSA
jgi:hypothetical protein